MASFWCHENYCHATVTKINIFGCFTHHKFHFHSVNTFRDTRGGGTFYGRIGLTYYVYLLCIFSVTELNNAEREILKHVQHRCFKQERERLKQADRQTSASRQNALKNSSSIFKLDPTLTQDELEVVYDRRQLITTQSTQSFCPRDTM